MYNVNNKSSDAISRDMNSLLHSSTFKHPAEGEFAKIKQLISSDPYPNYFSYQTQNQNPHQHDERFEQNKTSFFSNLLCENGGDDEFLQNRFITRQEEKNLLTYAASSTVMKQERKDEGGYGYGYANPRKLDCASSFKSNLVRQNSTPAGFMSSENGCANMKKGTSSSKLNTHVNFSSGPSSSPSRFLPQIAENKNEFHDSKFSSLKRSRDGVQNKELGNHTTNLVHHMSLPKTSSEMAVLDNFLQFQQESTVPWKIRAKRGCATHPRSIAERVRRTKISERIKRLQELFPEIDKQSNTADMLDMAVEYIKNLQQELQTLSDARARCKCSSKQLRSM